MTHITCRLTGISSGTLRSVIEYGLAFFNRLITPPPIGEQRIAMSVSVCLSVRNHIFGTTRPIFTNFLCLLPMALARSLSGGVVIRYVLPVL